MDIRVEMKGKPRVMLLDKIKVNETYEKIKRIASDRDCCRKWIPRT